MPLDLTPWTASIILGSLIVSTYARNFQMHAFPAPSPAIASSSGLASSDCYNYGALMVHLDTGFMGAVKRANLGTVEIAYRRFGPLNTTAVLQQRPLVLIIGIALTMHDWTPRFLRAVAADREVVIFDSPGIGLSQIAAGSVPAAKDYFKFQADSVASFITAIELPEPDVLGWSLGAKIALHIGLYHGSSVNKIVADAGSAGGNSSSTAVLDGFDGDITVAERLQRVGALLERPSNIHAVCQWLLERSVMPPDRVELGEIQAQLAAEAAYQAGQGIVPLLPQIRTPLLVITATNDMTNPPSNEVPIMEGTPDAVLVTFIGCGHLALFQEVDMFVAMLNGFTAASGKFLPSADASYTCSILDD